MKTICDKLGNQCSGIWTRCTNIPDRTLSFIYVMYVHLYKTTKKYFFSDFLLSDNIYFDLLNKPSDDISAYLTRIALKMYTMYGR